MRKLWDMFGIHDHPLFELMRLILPQLDTQRAMFQMKHKSLAKMYVEILGINEGSNDAQMILNWKRPAGGFQRTVCVRALQRARGRGRRRTRSTPRALGASRAAATHTAGHGCV